MKKIQQWYGLDLVKFICMIVMLVIQAIIYLISDYGTVMDTTHFMYPVILRLLFFGWFVYCLSIIAGCVLRLHFQKYIKKGKVKNYPLGTTVYIALMLSFLGFTMNLLAFGLDTLFAWNFLQFLSLSFIIISLLIKFLPIYSVYIFGVFVLFLAKPLTTIFPYYEHNFFSAILFDNPSNLFYYPIFPFFVLTAFGFFVADFYIKYRNSTKFNLTLVPVGIVFMSMAFFIGGVVPNFNAESLWAFSIFQPKIGVILAVIGFFSFLIVFANRLAKIIKFKKYGIVNCYSKGILWIYLLGLIITYRLAAYISGKFSVTLSVIIIFSLFILLLSWLVGVMYIKYLYNKKWTIILLKTNKNG